MAKQTQSPSSQARITPRQAFESAATFLRDLLGDVQEVRIEETELSDDERYWFITLAFKGKDHFFHTYKRFKIDARSGEVLSMAIRQV